MTGIPSSALLPLPSAAEAAPRAAAEAGPLPSARVRHLLDAARAAFIADGFDRVSIDAIALGAGVSKETIYRHFPDKPALFRAALEDMSGRFWQRAALRVQGGVADLTQMAGAIMDSAVEGGLLSPLWLAAGLAGRMPQFARELQEGQWARLEPLRLALEAEARGRGLLASVPIDLALDFGSLAVEGPALLLGFPAPDEIARHAIAARVAALFTGGLDALAQANAVPDRAEHDLPPGASAWPPNVARMLDAAAALFVAKGFEATTLDDVREAAQAGRGTLYRHFGSKEGLYRAALLHRAALIARQPGVPALAPGAAEAELAAFFMAAMGTLASPEAIDLHRCAISTSRREGALARTIHDGLRRPWIDPLADWIAARTGRPDARWLARQALVLALQGSRLFATGARLDAAAALHQARRTAAILLHGYGGALAPDA